MLRKWQEVSHMDTDGGSASLLPYHGDESTAPLGLPLTTAAFLAGLSCRSPLALSGFTAATAGWISTALRFRANLGEETTLTTDGFTFTLGLATRNGKYLISLKYPYFTWRITQNIKIPSQ